MGRSAELTVGIGRVKVEEGAVYYRIEVFQEKEAWVVFRRFSAFCDLDATLTECRDSLKKRSDQWIPSLPQLPSALWSNPLRRFDQNHVESRRVRLEVYLKQVLLIPILAVSEPVHRFLFTEAVKVNDAILDSCSPNQKQSEFAAATVVEGRVTSNRRIIYKILIRSDTRPDPFSTWVVFRTFSEFHTLHAALCHSFSPDRLPSLPPRIPIRLAFAITPVFLQRRSAQLDTYLGRLLASDAMRQSDHVLGFLGCL